EVLTSRFARDMFTTVSSDLGPDTSITSMRHPRGGAVSEGYEFSPNPRDVGFQIVSRRSLLAGAAGLVGAGILAACGDDNNASSSATNAPAGTAAPAGTNAPAGTTAPAGTAAPAGTSAPAATGDAVSVGVYEATGKNKDA